MCGRYVFYPGSDFSSRYQLDSTTQLAPNYNASPLQSLPVITHSSANQLNLMQWGLVPFWSKEPSASRPLINSRSETITQKPSFKHAFSRRRCLVPARGFYEWKKQPSGSLPYYFFFPDHQLFSFAGIYDIWQGTQGETFASFSIITTAADSQVDPVHSRMPVILSPAGEHHWLDPSADIAALLGLLQPLSRPRLIRHQVSALVNSPSQNSPQLILPV